MLVKILKVSTDDLVGATIQNGRPIQLPSIQQGWRFNFDRLIKSTPNATAFILVSEETPQVIEGCLIFQMKQKQIPYMAYVEVGPHNRGNQKKYDYVAGCLIAFACRQSFIHGKDHHQGWLTFDVMEEDPKDQLKLMAVYSNKYGAVRFEGEETTMYIMPANGEKLIEQYLYRK
ncbi:hypothetical protein [Dinghuibacter silviterrae]|uniref:Uncharacterized protein n=1 Tax=Dinghuibacter silviterrae TaxID=1539049 RepID=A0A4R8DTS4_9BACT|nr:hypothetical protein [Dinghuibacter silviterrae]TDX00531.1 hypothetical protein EDB95_1556 [Dinghuibacter silviterrae]